MVNKLNPDAIYEHNSQIFTQYEQVFEYSTNKIPESKAEDLFINFKNDQAKENHRTDWVPFTKVTIPNNNDFELQKPGNYFLFKIGDIDFFNSTFLNPNSNTNQSFTLEVKHKPTLSNYCHCILFGNFHDPEFNNFPIRTREKIRKRIASEIKMELIRISKFSEEDFNK